MRGIVYDAYTAVLDYGPSGAGTRVRPIGRADTGASVDYRTGAVALSSGSASLTALDDEIEV